MRSAKLREFLHALKVRKAAKLSAYFFFLLSPNSCLSVVAFIRDAISFARSTYIAAGGFIAPFSHRTAAAGVGTLRSGHAALPQWPQGSRHAYGQAIAVLSQANK